jgi:hypothetical protein
VVGFVYDSNSIALVSCCQDSIVLESFFSHELHARWCRNVFGVVGLVAFLFYEQFGII